MTDKKKLQADFTRYSQQCLAEVDAWNRANDDDLTIEEARARGGILTHRTFDDYRDEKYPERAAVRRKREAQQRVREHYLTLPLSERVRYTAMTEMAGVLRVHAANLEEIEQALELEMEAEEGMGLF